jgi:hypothetical protein
MRGGVGSRATGQGLLSHATACHRTFSSLESIVGIIRGTGLRSPESTVLGGQSKCRSGNDKSTWGWEDCGALSRHQVLTLVAPRHLQSKVASNIDIAAEIEKCFELHNGVLVNHKLNAWIERRDELHSS